MSDTTSAENVPIPAIDRFFRRPAEAFGTPVCRLGLAARGGSGLAPNDIHLALARGVNFLNWPGTEDALSRAVAELGPTRAQAVVCAQFESRTAAGAAGELGAMLSALRTDYLDVLTFYYVEEEAEWEAIRAPGGALEYCLAAQRDGLVRRLGLTTHQRPLAAAVARSGLLDTLMIRYNAAHRGAEGEVFPVADAARMPVIAYTALRWGALLRPTPDDPPGFVVPDAPSWYRFVLQHPAVAVALMAPHDRAELVEDLAVLSATGPLPEPDFATLAEHGRRVRRHAGGFP